ncbi:MAG: amidase [Bowdeniella nasicola]|nr:amidase [Bowdeniella nasicola]
MELYSASAAELATAYRKGITDPIEVTRELYARIAAHNVDVGAFISLAQPRADASAAAAREAIAAGDRRPLLGIACPIKDLREVAGEPFIAGSRILADNVATRTDGPAAQLAAAGTVMLGKTTTPEFGMVGYTEPAIGPKARTPWDVHRTAGGSSGGAGAALAAGLAPLAHGNDAGGSIRIPAACCNVVGLKPARGRISVGPYLQDGPGLVTDGVLTRTITDAALALDAISGQLPGDPYLPPAPASSEGSWAADVDATSFAALLQASERADQLTSYHGRPVRIGLLSEPLNVAELEFHPEALAASYRAARLLEAAGAEIIDVPRAISAKEWLSFMPLWQTGAASLPVPPAAEGELMAITRWLRDAGTQVSALTYVQAANAVQQLARDIATRWAHVDVVLSPTLSGPPRYPDELQLEDPAADFEAQKVFSPYTSVWNITGAPAISVPLHRAVVTGRDGREVELPFGVHLGAVTTCSEALLLRLARALELAAPWPHLAPNYR